MNSYKGNRLVYVVLVISLMLWCGPTVDMVLGMCPTPSPCHCVHGETIFCSRIRLKKLPYLMRFKRAWREMDLSDNLLTDLPENGFRWTRVASLNLSRNMINHIHKSAFRELEGVVTLDLSHNNLSNLPPGVFVPLEHLRTLKLRYNNLKRLAKDTFKGLEQLTELDLCGNRLSSVPNPGFSHLTSLKTLSLRQNKLHTISSYAFNGLPLEHLDLGDNRGLQEIPIDAFCGLEPEGIQSAPGVTEWTGVRTLRLDHSGLHTLHPCVSKIIWTLSLVDITGNPLNCDCYMLLLRDISNAAQFPEAQCASPRHFASLYLSDIARDRYDCSVNRTALGCDTLCPVTTPPKLKQNSSTSSANLISSNCVWCLSSASVFYTIIYLYIS